MMREAGLGGRRVRYARLADALGGAEVVARLPYSLRALFENVVRRSPGDLDTIRAHARGERPEREIAFHPGRVLMHDTTCVPALADIAAMRDAVAALGGDPARVNPVVPVHLVIDHSVMVDHYGTKDAAARNLARDFERNGERYRFVKWAEGSLANFRAVPPGTGIIHQVNLEVLAEVVSLTEVSDETPIAHLDVLVGTDSHTPMVNALGVLGWGVGGIEGQAAMVGEPVALQIPRVVGVRLDGALPPGACATDLVLTLTERLRRHGVVGKFVEFHGPGVATLSLADRATVANMAPEYGATCSFFPFDDTALDYLRGTGRSAGHCALVEAYLRAQQLWADPATTPVFDESLALDLATVVPSVAGPRQPHELLPLGAVPTAFAAALPGLAGNPAVRRPRAFPKTAGNDRWPLADGSVVLAAITSCTNTSNPALVVAAGLVARKARQLGLKRKPWVKTSLSPGSQVVAEYLKRSGLQDDLDALGFNVVGFGCMTCIGNSGPLEAPVMAAVDAGMVGVGVLSGNRNFDGRVNPHVAAGYLMSPALCVVYAIAGTVHGDLATEAVEWRDDDTPVMLADLMPTAAEVDAVIREAIGPALYVEGHADVWRGPSQWQAITREAGLQFAWDERSDYIRRPPYLDAMVAANAASVDTRPLAIAGARVLAKLGDNVTTDHLSPAGAIPPDSVAGRYLAARGVPVAEFNQYSTRRSNHEVMMRGALSNPKLVNELVPDAKRGGTTRAWSGDVMSVYDAAATYRERGVPLVILAGKNYGAGSSRDWAAKGPALLGVKAVVAESFERIHRANLIGMGIVPLVFAAGRTRHDLCGTGDETLDFDGLDTLVVGKNSVGITVRSSDGTTKRIEVACTIDSQREIDYLEAGGILPFVTRRALGR
jgi:aconitate hydratase